MSSTDLNTYDMVEALKIIGEVTPQQLREANPAPLLFPGESPPHRTHAQIFEDMRACEDALMSTYQNGEAISPSMVARDALHRSLWAMGMVRELIVVQPQPNVQVLVSARTLDTMARSVAPSLLYLSTLYPNQPAVSTDRFSLEHAQRSEEEQGAFLREHSEAVRFVLGNSYRPANEIVLRFIKSVPALLSS